jgi:tetratricopeptide (TPR) repeat protein
LCSRREPARLLVLGTYRPAEVTRGHTISKVVGELVAHRQASSIALDGFGAETLEAYLGQRFRDHSFPRQLVGALHRATGGNPLFLTTLLDDLEGQGVIRGRGEGWELSTSVDEVAARRPDGIARLIDTQIDRLSAIEQRVLEVASVAGTSFAAGVVAHALEADPDDVDSCCESLAGGRGLLQYLGTETWPDGTIQSRYGFRHALFQQIALARISSPRIRIAHRKIAERLEAGHAGREEDVAAELAAHYDEARLPAKAAQHFATAGEIVARRYAYREAVVHFERALALAPAMGSGREREAIELRASYALGRCLLQLEGAEAAIPHLQHAGELAGRLGDHARFAAVMVDLHGCILVRGDLQEAAAHAHALARLVEQTVPDDEALRARATQAEAVTAMLRARFGEARRLFGVLGLLPENLGRDVPATRHAVQVLVNGAFVAWLVGRPDTAVRLARWAHEGAEAGGDPFERAFVLAEWAGLHAWRREPREAMDLAKRALVLADEASFDVVRRRAHAILQWARIELNAAPQEDVDQWMRDSLGTISVARTIHLALFAATCLRLGRTDRALEEITGMLAFVERTDERIVEPELHRLRGEILKSTDPEEAQRSIRRAIAIAREQSSLALELRATLSLHALVSETEKKHVREDLVQLVSRFTEGLETADVVDAMTIVE